MEVLIKKTKKFSAKEISSTAKIIKADNKQNSSHTVAMTKGWQCCKCKETMYNDEMHCTWDRCNHRRCSN